MAIFELHQHQQNVNQERKKLSMEKQEQKNKSNNQNDKIIIDKSLITDVKKTLLIRKETGYSITN